MNKNVDAKTSETEKFIIAGNWKMNKTPEEAKNFLEEFLFNVKSSECKIILFVPFIDIEKSVNLIKESNINVIIGAQNFYWRDSGAYTGEISIPMLKAIGTKILLVGHSERRINFKETDKEINEKIKKATKSDMNVILCVGETLNQRKSGKEKEVIMLQLEKALKNVRKELISQISIAYEPIWAIGTGETAVPEDANKMCKFIKMCIEKMYNGDKKSNLKVLYGGSVDKENFKEFFKMPYIDGVLTGGASLSADSFSHMVKVADTIVKDF